MNNVHKIFLTIVLGMSVQTVIYSMQYSLEDSFNDLSLFGAAYEQQDETQIAKISDPAVRALFESANNRSQLEFQAILNSSMVNQMKEGRKNVTSFEELQAVLSRNYPQRIEEMRTSRASIHDYAVQPGAANVTIDKGSLLHLLVHKIGKAERKLLKAQKSEKLSAPKKKEEIVKQEDILRKYKSMMHAFIRCAPQLQFDFTLEDVEKRKASEVAFIFTPYMFSTNSLIHAIHVILAELQVAKHDTQLQLINDPDFLKKLLDT